MIYKQRYIHQLSMTYEQRYTHFFDMTYVYDLKGSLRFITLSLFLLRNANITICNKHFVRCLKVADMFNALKNGCHVSLV